MSHNAPTGEGSTAAALRAQLARLTAAITHSASLVAPGTAVVEVIRALDLRCFEVLGARRSAGEDVHGPDAGWYAPATPPWFGTSRALSILLDDRVDGAVEAFVIRDQSGAEWANEVLDACETIARLEHWLSHHAAGNAVIELDATGFLIRARHPPLAVEAVEREEVYAVDAISRQAQTAELNELRAARPAVLDAMASRLVIHNGVVDVRPTLEIASHYQRAGILTAQRMWNDQETFDGDVVLGGEPFYLYRGVAGILIGLALRHLDLIDIALRRDPLLTARSLLTVAGPVNGLAVRVAAHLGAELDETRKALESLTLWRPQVATYGAWPAAPAPLVQISRDAVAWSIAGTLAAPLEFLLTQLRARFRPEWDRAVDSREDRFREELYHLFTGLAPDRFATVNHAVAIREDGHLLTDVDALVFDRETGDLALFQLKWQDSLGFSGPRLASGRRNFTSTTSIWASRLKEWMRKRSLEAAGGALGLSTADCARVTGVRLFVVGRNFAHFSGVERKDEHIAWATWPQFLNRVSQLLTGGLWASGPLRLLHEHLHRDSPHRRVVSEVRPATFRIGSITVRVESLAPQEND